MHSSKTLDGFQSNVNVLQVSTPEISPASEVAYNANQTNQQFYGNKYYNSFFLLIRNFYWFLLTVRVTVLLRNM